MIATIRIPAAHFRRRVAALFGALVLTVAFSSGLVKPAIPSIQTPTGGDANAQAQVGGAIAMAGVFTGQPEVIVIGLFLVFTSQ
jgi:hypothetical protein